MSNSIIEDYFIVRKNNTPVVVSHDEQYARDHLKHICTMYLLDMLPTHDIRIEPIHHGLSIVGHQRNRAVTYDQTFYSFTM